MYTGQKGSATLYMFIAKEEKAFANRPKNCFFPPRPTKNTGIQNVYKSILHTFYLICYVGKSIINNNKIWRWDSQTLEVNNSSDIMYHRHISVHILIPLHLFN